MAARTSAPAITAKHPVFIDTNLDTHFLMSLSLLDSVSNFKRKIEKEHLSLFSDIGKIVVQALKVKRRGIFYVLSDSMMVNRAFASSKTNWFLSVDASLEPRREIEAPTEKQAELENGVVEKHVELENGVVEKQASQTVRSRKRKLEQPVAASGDDLRAIDTVSGKKKRVSKPKGGKAPDDAENRKNASETRGLEIETFSSKKTEALKENPEDQQMNVEVSAQNGVFVTQPATEERGALSEKLGSPRREETGPIATDGAADLGGGNESVTVPIKTGKKSIRTKKAQDPNVPAEPLAAQSGKVGDKDKVPKESSAAAAAKEGAENVEEPAKKKRTRRKQTEAQEDIAVAKSKPVAPSTAKKLKLTKDKIDSIPVEPEIETRDPTVVSGAGNKGKGLEKPSPDIVTSSEAPAEKKGVPKSTSPTESENPKEISGIGNIKNGPKKPLLEKKGVPKSTNPTETEKPKEVSGTGNKKNGPKKPLVEKKESPMRAPKTLKTSKINDKSPGTHLVQTSSNAQTSLKSNGKQGTRAVVVPDTSDATVKKLIATPGDIFGDDNSSSGDLGTDGSDDSTRTPSYDHSSDDSDSNSLQRGGSQIQDKSKGGNITSVVKSCGKKNSLPFELLLRRTSGYKSAKLTASQSQPEDESQPPDFVPDSLADPY